MNWNAIGAVGQILGSIDPTAQPRGHFRLTFLGMRSIQQIEGSP